MGEGQGGMFGGCRRGERGVWSERLEVVFLGVLIHDGRLRWGKVLVGRVRLRCRLMRRVRVVRLIRDLRGFSLVVLGGKGVVLGGKGRERGRMRRARVEWESEGMVLHPD